MDYTDATQALIADRRAVTRAAWDHPTLGVLVCLVLVPGSRFVVDADRPLGIARPDLVGREVFYGSHIDKVVDHGEHGSPDHSMAPWFPSLDDINATDWRVVE